MKKSRKKSVIKFSIVLLVLFIIVFTAIKEINALKSTVESLESELNINQKRIELANNKISKLVEEKQNYENLLSENHAYIQDLEARLEKIAGEPINSLVKTAYLTFDDGPGANTNKILDILDKYNIKASFFVIGKTGEHNIKAYNRIIDEGHALGNHTFSHQYKSIYKNTDAFMNDLYKLEDHIFEITGHTPDIVRFPGGSSNSYIENRAEQFTLKLLAEGYQYFDWNVDSGDALSTPITAFEIINRTVNSSKNKRDAIILMHEKNTTVNALPTIIEYLSDLGYTFKTLEKNSFYVHHR